MNPRVDLQLLLVHKAFTASFKIKKIQVLVTLVMHIHVHSHFTFEITDRRVFTFYVTFQLPFAFINDTRTNFARKSVEKFHRNIF